MHPDINSGLAQACAELKIPLYNRFQNNFERFENLNNQLEILISNLSSRLSGINKSEENKETLHQLLPGLEHVANAFGPENDRYEENLVRLGNLIESL